MCISAERQRILCRFQYISEEQDMIKICAVAMATGILTFALFFAASMKTVSAPEISGESEMGIEQEF